MFFNNCACHSFWNLLYIECGVQSLVNVDLNLHCKRPRVLQGNNAVSITILYESYSNM